MRAADAEADPQCSDAAVMRRARIALASVCEPGEPGLSDAIDQLGASVVIARLLRGDATLRIPRRSAIGERLAALDLDTCVTRTSDLGARVIVPGDREWPGQLDDLGSKRPIALWCWGSADLRLHAVRSVAVVGARACTRYGEWVAREWSAELAGEGVTIVSGGAYGVDAAAHRGALAVGQSTVCVLAGGVDNVYPRGHDGLFSEILERGVLVSEAPPGEVVRRGRFLSRNRVIAALTSVTCVVEASRRSGAASTAHHAVELARTVVAVPGPVTSAMSEGTNRLIADQVASAAVDASDITALVGPIGIPGGRVEVFDGRQRAEYREVIDALEVRTPRSAPEIARRSGVHLDRVHQHLQVALESKEAELDEHGMWTYVSGASSSG